MAHVRPYNTLESHQLELVQPLIVPRSLANNTTYKTYAITLQDIISVGFSD